MNIRTVSALARRDFVVALRQKAILTSILIVSISVLVILPVGVILLLRHFGGDFLNLSGMADQLPSSIVGSYPRTPPTDLFAITFLTHYFAPLFLVLPLMVAISIAVDSLAGEKERRTLETLLHTPITDTELIVGKVLAATIPAIVVSGGGFIIYTVVADVLGYWIVNTLVMPTATWWVLVLWTTPAAAMLGLGSAVLVSSRTSSVQAANQLAPIVVLPIVVLVYSQIAGAIDLNPLLMALIGAITWVLALLLIGLGIRSFRRTEQISVLSE